ncbi:CbxX/CfqX [Metarhizium album ARSEF 1941]|uniref:CbxX/CfqX n=1 Tax=Metarhizium album (strain ARSEF 1941) TaxID=1081103 RepID=A0A0B2WUG8_METAS|nr:CbxX/CfqX [Metarhizium album ARSEF 1941]KHN99716.1 CbxX/CfqX [Metarhizium album ARSEF 1941]
MASAELATGRAKKLIERFKNTIEGKCVIGNNQDATHFLEATDILCRCKTPVFYVESIISSAKGIETLGSVVRSDLSEDFISSVMTTLLKHLSSSAVKAINSGQFLRRILIAVLCPPTFWSAAFQYYQSPGFGVGASETFAWLCLEIVSMKTPDLNTQYSDITALMDKKSLIKASSHPVRQLAYRIEKILKLHSIADVVNTGHSPGGRHDNDFLDFRAISIYPTADEVLSVAEPFLQQSDDVFDSPRESRAATYLSWLFRLLREDMLADMREYLAVAWGQKKGRRIPLQLGGLRLAGFNNVSDKHVDPLALRLQCEVGIVFPPSCSKENRKDFLESSKSFMKHNSMGALCRNNEIIAFGCLIRDVDLLLKKPPIVVIRFINADALKKSVEALLHNSRGELQFYVVDTATFAYEPILQRLKDIHELPLEDMILEPKSATSRYQPPPNVSLLLGQLRAALEKAEEVDLSPVMEISGSIRISGAQLESLINGLENCVGQIQGPPGTGKSFIGALISRIMLRLTNYRILVLSYTNHALDQFLEDLQDFGVPEGDMVRIGAKSTRRTESLRLQNLFKMPMFRFSRAIDTTIRQYKSELSNINDKLADVGAKLAAACVAADDILTMLEFSEDWTSFWAAFQVPKLDDGFEIFGKNNKPMQANELLELWLRGKNSGTLDAVLASMDPKLRPLWKLPRNLREGLFDQWCSKVRHDQTQEFVDLAEMSNNIQREIDSLYNESKRKVLQSKRVIACTTTAAAMYHSIIESAQPDMVLVEEAGEILEAHIITALSSSVKQLVLIGDHKQLRPKVMNYSLTVEKGEGFNLNMSLFERLIHQGHSYTTLQEQHRSHPKISHFVRRLAYEHLEDHPKTLERDTIRGLKGRVIFVHHEHQEETLADVVDLVRYLSQQGYKSKDMVVLTPYMGQLSLLRKKLSRDHDPWLSDMDSYELARAGLMTEAAAKLNKQQLRLSTIDNYQGEESDIVIASLTRSNASGDIGFMCAPERLVVLMSRAKSCIVLFGNMHTFIKSKKGGELWQGFFQALSEQDCLFDGVPVYCERHPGREALLKSAEDFHRNCPDGGCAEPWGHKLNIVCSSKMLGCKSCAREDEETRRRAAKDLELEALRQEKQEAYASELQKIDDEIDHYERVLTYKKEEEAQQAQLKRKEAKLNHLKKAKERRDAIERPRREKDVKTGPGAESRKSSAPKFESKAQQEWEMMKDLGEPGNKALDNLMGLIGLEAIKEEFLAVKSNIDTKIRQGLPLSEERLSCSLLGNPGTGKTTVARLWAEFLASTGALPGNGFTETSGSKLANIGVSGCEQLLQSLKDDGGGVLFIDEAYQLSSGNSPGGKVVLDYLLAEVENLRGKVSFVIAGYNKQMETFFAHNPGFPSRFPVQMRFLDYSDGELLQILQRQVDRKYNGNMAVEDGPDGLYFRIASRRLGRGRDREGFGNARAVENAVAQMEKRQSRRLRKERRAGSKPDDYLFTKEDIIGPEPSATLANCQAWQRLNEMIGLAEVKQEVRILLDSLTTNYQRELAEEPLMSFSLNRVFVGSPGTGKTTVAKLYGQILASLGMLSDGEVVAKTPADFIGSVLGQSEAQTKGILASTIGKVLVIDEAYGLQGAGGTEGSHSADPYRTAVVDTIVAEVQNVPGEDRCVILLGYKEQMEEMFQNVNPGLGRRFAIDSPFVFHDFDDEALSRILDLKLRDGGFRATSQAKKVALDILARERNRPNFGNAGAIDNLLSKAKAGYQKRTSAGTAERSQLESIDFDDDFDRRSATDVEKLFAGDIGREKVVSLLKNIQDRVRQLKTLGMDINEEIPFNFLFRGPPGTGKTMTARKFGKLYYDMGFLSKAQVVECSATDLVGQYVGQTGPKVQKVLNNALGEVLFIDEAYRLAGPGFAKEAVDELVDSVTKEKYKGKLIIILAGYVKDINNLLAVNPGMTSRFPETIDFEPLSAEDCLKLLTSSLVKRKVELEGKGKVLDLSCLQCPSDTFERDILDLIRSLTRVEGWASARDVKQLAKGIFRSVDLSLETLKVGEDHVEYELSKMLRERSQMEQDSTMADQSLATASPQLRNGPRPPSTCKGNMSIESQQEEEEEEAHESQPDDVAIVEPDPEILATDRLGTRDAGVSDEVWEQLQQDWAEGQRREKEHRELKAAQKSARDADRERIVRQLLEEEKRRKAEAARKAKLMAAGTCPVGYHWIRQSRGYRCAGGSHFMSDADVDAL